MRILTTFLATAIFGLVFAACSSNTASNNGANNTTAHDMSNMGNHDMSNMSGQGMSEADWMKSAPDAEKQPYDLQFIDAMIVHHQGAVKMAQMVLGKTHRDELKGFAQKTIDDQTKEIAQLTNWRNEWYPGKPSALNMNMPGMMNQGMKIMNSEHMKTMDEMEPEHFDNHFLNMMIPHHQGAIDMSKEALKKAEHQEIKDMANRIIASQSEEIKQMERWKAAWNRD